MNSLRIALVCHEYPPGKHGGIGTFTRNHAQALVAAGHQVRVIGSYRRSDADVDDGVDDSGDQVHDSQGVQVWRLRASRWRWGWLHDRYRVFRQLSQWSRQGEIDAIELADWEGWAAGWPPLPVPVIVRLHGSASYFANEMGKQPRRRTRWLESASLRRADYWCSVSRYTANRTRIVLKPRSEPTAILYNSVDLRPQRSLAERRKFDVVYTGTLTIKKGVVSLFQAWPQVVQAIPEARLHVYGRDGIGVDGGSMQQYLLQQLDDHTRSTVHFYGHCSREQVLQALDTAHLAVFPSYAEAFALAPLEAMAGGCPTIYSQRGSGAELIQSEQDGLLIDPDQPQQISAAMIRVLKNNTLADKLGTNGRKCVQTRFSTRQFVSQNEQFYRHCIELYRASRRARAS